MTRNLSDVLNQNVNQKTQTDTQTDSNIRSFNTYLTSFNLQLVHRFPEVTDLDLTQIDYEVIKSIAEFCAVTDVVAHQVWLDFNQPSDKTRRQQMIARQTRAA